VLAEVHCVWLNALKKSLRRSQCSRSAKWRVLATEMSQLFLPGPHEFRSHAAVRAMTTIFIPTCPAESSPLEGSRNSLAAGIDVLQVKLLGAATKGVAKTHYVVEVRPDSGICEVARRRW